MEVVITTRGEEFFDDYDYRDFFQVEVNGNVLLEVRDGEPEDNNLARNFSDIRSIETLLHLAYEAGKKNESFTIEYEKARHRSE